MTWMQAVIFTQYLVIDVIPYSLCIIDISLCTTGHISESTWFNQHSDEYGEVNTGWIYCYTSKSSW